MLGKLPLTHMQHLLINAHKGNIYKGTKHKGTMSRQLVAAVKTVVQARCPLRLIVISFAVQRITGLAWLNETSIHAYYR